MEGARHERTWRCELHSPGNGARGWDERLKLVAHFGQRIGHRHEDLALEPVPKAPYEGGGSIPGRRHDYHIGVANLLVGGTCQRQVELRPLLPDEVRSLSPAFSLARPDSHVEADRCEPDSNCFAGGAGAPEDPYDHVPQLCTWAPTLHLCPNLALVLCCAVSKKRTLPG